MIVAGDARANGRYPNASLMAFDPNDARHFVISVTFGLLETRDGGGTFQWRCDSALEAKAPQDMMVAITSSGATVAAKFDGVITTTDGCSFRTVPELAGKNVVDLALRKSAPHSLVAFYADTRASGGFESQIMRSEDHGQTWSSLGAPLPDDLFPITIDVAPSDAARVYLSGRLESESNFSSVLLRSTDGGETFQRGDVPETSEHRLAYIAAVHPLDPDRVYVRTLDPQGTRVWLTDDGGVTFRRIFAGAGQLFGFAVSPDGTKLALGGPSDGVWVGGADGTDLTRRADVQPTCLAWNGDGLWACADHKKPPFFSVGISRDLGVTFEKVLRFDELCAHTGCGGDTETGAKCADDWEAVAPMVGTTCGTRAGGADGSLDGDAPHDGAANAAAPDSSVAAPGSKGGCSCALDPRPAGQRAWWLVVAAWPLLRRARKQRAP